MAHFIVLRARVYIRLSTTLASADDATASLVPALPS
jgi:hypothetical protein